MPNILRNGQTVSNFWFSISWPSCSLNPRISFPPVYSPISWAPPFNFSWADQPTSPFHRPSPSWTRTGMASSTRMIWGTPLLLLVCPPARPAGGSPYPSHPSGGRTTVKVKSLSFFKETAQSWLAFKTSFGRQQSVEALSVLTYFSFFLKNFFMCVWFWMQCQLAVENLQNWEKYKENLTIRSHSTVTFQPLSLF